jgi:hypothetical protein
MSDSLTEQHESSDTSIAVSESLFLSSSPLDRDVFVTLYNDVVIISALLLVRYLLEMIVIYFIYILLIHTTILLSH